VLNWTLHLVSPIAPKGARGGNRLRPLPKLKAGVKTHRPGWARM